MTLREAATDSCLGVMSSPDDSRPVVMRGVITSADWPALAWSPGDWVEAVMEEVIRVRRGEREPDLDTPQWERNTEVMEIRTREYFDPEWRAENIKPGTWSYFDYQYMNQALRPDRSVISLDFLILRLRLFVAG